MNPEQLKNSILQFALQGKLTDLEFSQSKDQGHFLSTKHEISNFNSSADEELFEIPHHWTWTKLKDISQYIKAGGDKPKNFSIDKTDKHNVPVIANGKKNRGIVGYTEESKISDVCLTISGRGTIGYTEIREEPFVPIVRLIVVSPLPNVSIHYLKYYLNAFLAPSVGTSIPQLTIPMIKEKNIALPPLEEQKKIVEKLDFIFNVVDKYEKSYTLLLNLQKSFPNQLEKSILQYAIEGKLVEQDTSDEPASELLKRISEQKEQMIKEKVIKKEKPLPPITEEEIPFDIPDTWRWAKLGDLVSINSGLSYKKSDLAIKTENMVRVLRGGNISPFQYTFKDDDIWIDSAYAKNSVQLKKHTLITPAVTSLEQIGKLAYIDQDLDNVTIGGFVLSIIPILNNETFSKYLMYMLNSGYYRNALRGCTNKSGQAFYNLSKVKLKNLVVPIPPLEEQKRLINKIESLLEMKKRLTELNHN